MTFSGQLWLYWVMRRCMVRFRMMGECPIRFMMMGEGSIRFRMSCIGSVVWTSRGGKGS